VGRRCSSHWRPIGIEIKKPGDRWYGSTGEPPYSKLFRPAPIPTTGFYLFNKTAAVTVIRFAMRRSRLKRSLRRSIPSVAAVLPAIGLLAVSACTGSVGSGDVRQFLPVRVLYESAHCSAVAGVPGMVRITGEAQLQSTMAGPGLSRSSTPAVGSPEADFTSEEVILVNMGQKRTGGYRVALHREQAVVSERTARIALIWAEPGADDVVAQALTRPCIILALPKDEYSRIVIVDQDGRNRMQSPQLEP